MSPGFTGLAGCAAAAAVSSVQQIIVLMMDVMIRGFMVLPRQFVPRHFAATHFVAVWSLAPANPFAQSASLPGPPGCGRRRSVHPPSRNCAGVDLPALGTAVCLAPANSRGRARPASAVRAA